MRHNQVIRAGKRTAASVSRISSAFQHGAVFSVLMFAALVLGGCAGLVSGTTSNPPSPSTLVISNVQTTSTTTSTSQIEWTTNVAADSVVNYGTTTSYGYSTPLNSAMVTNHQLTLSGLAGGTTYYYEVASADSKGNHGKSGGHSFKTLGFSISGAITPAAGGSGATLTLTGAANATTTADSLGNYTFAGLLNGTYEIAPNHAGFTFTPSSQSTTVNGANVTGVNFTDTPASAAPTITTQPVSQTVTAGQTAAFTVAATGTAPLNYQWSKNGARVSGATSSTYTTPTTTSSDNGAQFTVVVSNGAGSITSNAATLTVNASTTTPQFGHVAIVVEENTNYSSVVGTTAMPYLNSLMNQYGLGTQYYANTHPSIGNYFMLATGQILTNDDSQTPSTFPVSVDNIALEVQRAGKTWKDYRELTGTYYVRHDPLAYMTNINSANLVSFPQFATDLANGTLPNLSWIVPNGCDDAHDCSLSTADSWLKTNVDPLIKNAAFQKDGLLILVFDESANDNTDGGGRVVATFISPAFSLAAYQSATFYQHESSLRLMLEGLGIHTLPGASATAPAMWEFFDSPASTGSLAVSTTGLPAGTVTAPYSTQLNATGGTTPYAWTVASGALPAGLTLSSSGVISGVPSAAGASTFSAKVTDMNLQTAQQSLSITTSASSVCAPTGSGVCYYVSPTGSDSNAGTSAAPFQTIQRAANVVNPGDMVIVRDGTYNNAAVSGVGSKLIVMSRGGTAANHVVFTAEHKWRAKIDGLNNTSATGWEFSANYIDVRNFECEGFSDTCMENYNGGSSSGGQFISITGNNIHDVGRYCTTTTTGRDGIFISNDNVTIEGNQIHDIGRGAPGEVLSGVTCVDSVNTLHYQNNDHGIYVDAGFTSANNLTVKNNVFYRNERGWSIQVYPAAVSNLRVLNNTFLCANPYRNGHITLSAPITNSAIENNISWEPTTGFLDYSNTTGYSNLSVANNLTYQGTVGAGTAPGGITLAGNLDNIDPRIVTAPSCTVDAASIPDAHLQIGSLAIDMGLTLLDVPMDYDGTARPQGIKFDLGAFELIP